MLKDQANFRMSYNDAEQHLEGRAWKRFLFAWTWSAVHFSDLGREQLRHTKRFGWESTKKRINKVRTILGYHPY